MTDDTALRILRDTIEIRRVLDEYCLRLEVNPFEEWLDLFTDDTVYEVHRHVLTGRQEVSDMLSQAPHGTHLPGALRIALGGDRAETVQNYYFIADEAKFTNRGWYYRTLVRVGDGWKIAHTRVKIQK
jgi:hypothetical protein